MRLKPKSAAVSLASLVVLLSLLVSCEQRQQPNADVTQLDEIERDPGKGLPSRDAEGLRSAQIITEAAVPEQAKDPKCPFTVSTFVRAETGTNCDTYRAEIAGTSRRCVKECDDKARLAEAIASARLTCADFCKKKKCPGPRYQAPAKCAERVCGNSPECDPVVCPKLNFCALLQDEEVWNCLCLED
jgi:hypothetical protein